MGDSMYNEGQKNDRKFSATMARSGGIELLVGIVASNVLPWYGNSDPVSALMPSTAPSVSSLAARLETNLIVSTSIIFHHHWNNDTQSRMTHI